MELGLGLPVSGVWATPESVARIARRAEELGYRSLWTFQRLLVGAEQELAPVYRSVLDPIVALAFAASHTSSARLGVAVVNLPFIAPPYLAKQAASLDVLSGGRFNLGLGTGWSDVEFTATGSSPARRGARTEEYLAVLRALWADEVSAYDGRFYTLPPSRMLPKPVQRRDGKPGLPVLLGGSAETALRRAGRLADGWISASMADLTQIANAVRLVRAGAEEAGRDPAGVRIVCRGVLYVGERQPNRPLSGSYDDIREGVEMLASNGVTELFYDLNWDPLVGSPDADPVAATERAEEIITTLAPRR